MDVIIKSSDKQAREAFIKARDDKQAARDRRAQKRKDRKKAHSDTVTERRLQRRIEKKVRLNLLTEKRNYLRDEATGGPYVIDTRISYKEGSWRYRKSFVEGILNDNLAKHTGFEYKVDFDTASGEDGWCNYIRIWYTLLER